MAGDWIKVRTGLRRDPRVLKIASLLAPRTARICARTCAIARTICALVDVWSFANERAKAVGVDAVLEHSTPQMIDEIAGWKGFAAAMVKVDWMVVSPGEIRLPRFLRHNRLARNRRASEPPRRMATETSDTVLRVASALAIRQWLEQHARKNPR